MQLQNRHVCERAACHVQPAMHANCHATALLVAEVSAIPCLIGQHGPMNAVPLNGYIRMLLTQR